MTGPGRFLIVSWEGGGNAPPALNLGARLGRLGHQVRLLGWESMAPRAAAAGAEFRDQPDNAERVAASGAGRIVAAGASPAEIAIALREVLADSAALRAARGFAGVIAGLGGGDAATREVARLARSRVPAGPGQSW